MKPPQEIDYILGGGQSLRVGSTTLRTINAYCQRLPWKSEAGGQLFGRVGVDEVLVEEASRPSRRDERGRYHFRSHPETAKAAIASAHARGLLFLGEWHTHAERIPHPSWSDWEAIAEITKRSRLNTSRLVLLIRGTAALPLGLGAFLLPPQRNWRRFPVFETLPVQRLADKSK